VGSFWVNSDSPARLEIDGHVVPAGKDLRLGSVHCLEGADLVVWIRKVATAPLRGSVLTGDKRL